LFGINIVAVVDVVVVAGVVVVVVDVLSYLHGFRWILNSDEAFNRRNLLLEMVEKDLDDIISEDIARRGATPQGSKRSLVLPPSELANSVTPLPPPPPPPSPFVAPPRSSFGLVSLPHEGEAQSFDHPYDLAGSNNTNADSNNNTNANTNVDDDFKNIANSNNSSYKNDTNNATTNDNNSFTSSDNINPSTDDNTGDHHGSTRTDSSVTSSNETNLDTAVRQREKRKSDHDSATIRRSSSHSSDNSSHSKPKLSAPTHSYTGVLQI
jgi:hypothetical protein